MKLRSLVLIAFCSLVGCTQEPPDIPACTGFAAIEWPPIREALFRACAEDVTCARHADEYRAKIASWSTPTDSGWCKMSYTGQAFDIDEKHPAPWKGKDGKPKPWRDIYDGGVHLPAKEGWAVAKTWWQVYCRKNSGLCKNGVGNWESTIQDIDAHLASPSP